jgi:hypothetical protein
MRFQVLAGSVVALGLLLVAAACTTETIYQTVPGDTDAGSSGTSGRGSSGKGTSGTSGGEEEEEEDAGGSSSSSSSSSSGSSGNPSQGIKSDVLAQGTLTLVGLAGDDAIYVEFSQSGNAIKAVPIAGGTPTKIADYNPDDPLGVAGGAVAIWTGVPATGPERGTLNVWTRATGLKTDVATNSVPGLFAASADGSRIAFTQGATVNGAGNALESAEVGIRDTAAAANAATLTGTGVGAGNAVNLATTSCDPDWGFVGKVFIAAHCTGTSATAVNAKVLLVPDGATPTVTRLDASGSATPAMQPFWLADATASKVLYMTTSTKQLRVREVGGDAINIDTDVAQPVLLSDGSAVIYRKTSGELVKATVAATPVTTPLATGVKSIVGLSGDQKQVLFHKLDRVQQLADLHVVDHTAATPSPVVIEATASVLPAGFNGASSHVLFLGDVGATGASLKSIPVGGGTAKTIAQGTLGARAVSQGNGAIFLSNRKQLGQPPNTINVFDLSFVDTVAGGQPLKINDSMPQGEFRLKGKRLVYSKLAQQGSGLYAATLP